MNIQATSDTASMTAPDKEAVSIEGFGVAVIVTRSAGSDRAVVVFIDTAFEPDGSPGLRVLVNDGDAYIGVPYRTPDTTSEAGNG